MKEEEIRKMIAVIYWDLQKNYRKLWEQGDDREVFYDVGLMIGYCYSIGKNNLGSKIYDKFMEGQ